jgi:hypothetical protein
MYHAEDVPGPVEAAMAERGYGRLSAASGIAFVVVLTVALFLPGSPPKASDSAATITAVLADHRGAFVVGTYVAGIAIALGIWFFATVRAWLAASAHEPGDQLATVALAAGVLALGLVALGMVLFYGAAYKVAGENQLAVVRALTDAGNGALVLMKLPFAVFVAAVALAGARHALLPRWFTLAGAAAAALLLAGAIPLFGDGDLTEFGGPLDVGGAAPAMLWVVALSVILTRRAGVPAVSPPGPDPSRPAEPSLAASS